MSGYRDDDEHDPTIEFEDSGAVLYVLMAPGLIGGLLIYKGIAERNYVYGGGGLLVLLGLAAMIYFNRNRGC